MLNETARVVDVVDSFDPGSTFSFRLSAGYLYSSRSTGIDRELRTSPGALGTVGYQRVAEYSESTHTLMLNAEVGLFRDLALTFGAPVVLSNTRSLRAPAGVSQADLQRSLADGWTHNNMPTQLFSPNFDSPERSGIDQVRLGLQWAILNQQRDPTYPTWMVRFEWRPPVGDPIRACQQLPEGQTVCPAVNSIPSAPPGGGTNSTGATSRAGSGLSPGISRGVHGIYFQTMVSRRLGYLEPYAGFDILGEFPRRDTPFRYLDTPSGQLGNFPPIVSSLTVGTEIIPWENRETWQRFVIDLRLQGTYRSQGRDFSQLYDALGTSTSRALLAPGCPANQSRNADGSCQPGREIYFDGLTTTASHIVLTGSLGISIQPAKFLRFNLGANLAWVAPHGLTATDACNPNAAPPPSNPEFRGGCVSNSSPDPQHRPVIDQPGNRFRSTEDFIFDFYASIALTPRF